MFKIFSPQVLGTVKMVLKSPSLITRTLKSDLKIKWVRPEKALYYDPSQTGDLGSYSEPNQSNYCLQFEKATELEDAEKIVQKQFTLDWNHWKYTYKYFEKIEMDKVRAHILDYDSLEAKVAKDTAFIRYNQHYLLTSMATGKKRMILKIGLKKTIQRRKKLLAKLRDRDYKLFEWILETLDLQYKPEPAPEDVVMIARKESLRQLTRLHCEDIRNTRLNEYRKLLEAEQIPFLEKKLKNLEFIRSEQIELDLEVTVTPEQIDEVRQQCEELKEKRAESNKDKNMTKKWKVY